MSRPHIEIVVPVRDESRTLEPNVTTLVSYLDRHPERLVPGMERQGALRWRVTIAENGSSDDTAEIARRLAARDPRIAVLELGAAGRGGALRAAWLASDADLVAYMDVDLSTNLAAFGDLIAPLLAHTADVAIGTRLAPASRVRRRLRREVLSRGYNALARGLCDARFSDAQCGFKALRADVARELVPQVADDGWFFDTEVLLLAQRAGHTIHEVPAEWIEDLDSRVRIIPTVVADVRGLWRLRARPRRRAGTARRRPARAPVAVRRAPASP